MELICWHVQDHLLIGGVDPELRHISDHDLDGARAAFLIATVVVGENHGARGRRADPVLLLEDAQGRNNLLRGGRKERKLGKFSPSETTHIYELLELWGACCQIRSGEQNFCKLRQQREELIRLNLRLLMGSSVAQVVLKLVVESALVQLVGSEAERKRNVVGISLDNVVANLDQISGGRGGQTSQCAELVEKSRLKVSLHRSQCVDVALVSENILKERQHEVAVDICQVENEVSVRKNFVKIV